MDVPASVGDPAAAVGELTAVLTVPLLVDALVRLCRTGTTVGVAAAPGEAARTGEGAGAGGCMPSEGGRGGDGGGAGGPSGATGTTGGGWGCGIHRRAALPALPEALDIAAAAAAAAFSLFSVGTRDASSKSSKTAHERKHKRDERSENVILPASRSSNNVILPQVDISSCAPALSKLPSSTRCARLRLRGMMPSDKCSSVTEQTQQAGENGLAGRSSPGGREEGGQGGVRWWRTATRWSRIGWVEEAQASHTTQAPAAAISGLPAGVRRISQKYI